MEFNTAAAQRAVVKLWGIPDEGDIEQALIPIVDCGEDNDALLQCPDWIECSVREVHGVS